MQDIIHRRLNFDKVADVVVDEPKLGMRCERCNVLLGTGRVVVHANDFVPLVEEILTEMRANESGAAGNQISSHRSVLSSDIKSRVNKFNAAVNQRSTHRPSYRVISKAELINLTPPVIRYLAIGPSYRVISKAEFFKIRRIVDIAPIKEIGRASCR